MDAGIGGTGQQIGIAFEFRLVCRVEFVDAREFHRIVPAGEDRDIVAVLAEVRTPGNVFGRADDQTELGCPTQFDHLLEQRFATRLVRQGKQRFRTGGFGFVDQVHKVGGADRILFSNHNGVTILRGVCFPQCTLFRAPVGFLLEDGDLERSLPFRNQCIEDRERIWSLLN